MEIKQKKQSVIFGDMLWYMKIFINMMKYKEDVFHCVKISDQLLLKTRIPKRELINKKVVDPWHQISQM